MMGTAGPRLRPLDPDRLQQAGIIASKVDADRIRRNVIRLALPHNRLFASEAMDACQAYIIDSLQRAGWDTQVHPFTLTNATGFLDPSVGDGRSCPGSARVHEPP